MLSLLVLTLNFKCRSFCPSLFEYLCLFSLRFPRELSFNKFADFFSQFHGFHVFISNIFQIFFNNLYFNLRDPKAWDRPRTVGLSQSLGQFRDIGTVPGRWDSPKDPESQHHESYFSISETQKPGTAPGRWVFHKEPTPEPKKPGTVP